MVRFQIACLLLGVGATYSAKKQKQLHAGLFDQRKLDKTADKRRSSDLGGVFEMASREELKGLTVDLEAALEVV
jgi:hypothetical protein